MGLTQLGSSIVRGLCWAWDQMILSSMCVRVGSGITPMLDSGQTIRRSILILTATQISVWTLDRAYLKDRGKRVLLIGPTRLMMHRTMLLVGHRCRS